MKISKMFYAMVVSLLAVTWLNGGNSKINITNEQDVNNGEQAKVNDYRVHDAKVTLRDGSVLKGVILLSYCYVDWEANNGNYWLPLNDVKSVDCRPDGTIHIRMIDGKYLQTKAFYDVIPVSTLVGDLCISIKAIRTIEIGDLAKEKSNRRYAFDMGVKSANISRARPRFETKWTFITFRLSILTEDADVYRLFNTHCEELVSLSRQCIAQHREEKWLGVMSIEEMKAQFLAQVRQVLATHGASDQQVNSNIDISVGLFQIQ